MKTPFTRFGFWTWTLVLTLSLGLDCLLVNAHSKSHKTGYKIEFAPQTNLPLDEGSTTEINGSFCLERKGRCKKSSLEKVEVQAFFPDSTQDVTNKLNLQDQKFEKNFQFQTPPLDAQTPNTFTLIIGDIPEKLLSLIRLRDKLTVLKSWFEKRIEKLQEKNKSPKLIALLQKLVDKLDRSIEKIEQKIDQIPRTELALRSFPLLVDNVPAAQATYRTEIGGFVFEIESSKGVALQGDKLEIEAKIENRSSKKKKDYQFQVVLNDEIVHRENLRRFQKGNSFSHSLMTDALQNPGELQIEIRLFERKRNRLKRLVGQLRQTILIVADNESPTWLASTDAEVNLPFVQDRQDFKAILKDPFGTIDRDSIEAILKGTLLNGMPIETDLTPFLNIQKIEGEERFEITGSLQTLSEGDYEIEFRARDQAQNPALPDPLIIPFTADQTAPQVLAGIQPPIFTADPALAVPLTVIDTTPTMTSVFLNGNPVLTTDQTDFTVDLTLAEGPNLIRIESTDSAGNSTQAEINGITLDTLGPTLFGFSPQNGETLTSFTFPASGQSNENLSEVTLNGDPVPIGPNLRSFSTNFTASENGALDLIWKAKDELGNETTEIISVILDVPSEPLPPNPEEIAPEIDMTVSSNLIKEVEFLYTGSDPVQTGLDPQIIEEKRVAVLRGKVIDDQDNPLAGVRITILQEPDFGQTLSREDGMFDFALNGGKTFTVNYEKEGFLTVQRDIEVPWRDFRTVETIAMTPLDPKVTEIAANQSVGQIAQGTQVTDIDGSRVPSLYFPPELRPSSFFPMGRAKPLQLSTFA